MFELLILLILPGEISPEKLGMKYILKEKFIDYQSCEDYVQENLYLKENNEMGIFYKLDTKEYRVFLTYCKPTKEKQ